MRKEDWPGQVPQPHVLGNFRNQNRYFPSAASRARAKRAAREDNSLAHLALVRQLWCCLGHERQNIDCHHLQAGPARQWRGFGMKSPDRWVVPLVRWRHEELHRLGSRHEFEFFMSQGINPYNLAWALWINTGNLATMGRVLVAQQLDGTRRKLQAKELDKWIIDLRPSEWHRL